MSLLLLAKNGFGRANVAPEPPNAWAQHVPPSLTMQSDIAFDAWGDTEHGGAASGELSGGGYVDETAPHSPPHVARFVLLAGARAGGSLGQRGRTLPAGTVAVYTVCNFKVSPNYTVHPANQKLLYAFDTTGQTLGSWVFGVRPGAGETDLQHGTLRWSFDPQEAQTVETTFWANLGSGEVVRDRWYRVEVLTVRNTPGAADGQLRVWIDGVLTHAYDAVVYGGAAEVEEWRNLALDVYYGGNTPGHVVTEDCDIRVDHWSVYSATTRPGS